MSAVVRVRRVTVPAQHLHRFSYPALTVYIESHSGQQLVVPTLAEAIAYLIGGPEGDKLVVDEAAPALITRVASQTVLSDERHSRLVLSRTQSGLEVTEAWCGPTMFHEEDVVVDFSAASPVPQAGRIRVWHDDVETPC